MRVAIISELKKGGVEKVNFTLAENLFSYGMQVRMISIQGNEKAKNVQFDHVCLNQKNKKKCYPLLKKALGEFKPDIILTDSFLDSLLAILYSKKKLAKVVYVQHSVYSSVKGNTIKQKIINEILPKTIKLFDKIQGIVFVSYGVKCDFNMFFKNYKAKTIVIYNPITEASIFNYRKIEKKPLRLVTAGRIEIEKDQETLIRAIKILHERNIDVVLSIYGEGILKAQLQLLTKKLGVENRVLFQGFSDNLQDEFLKHDIFVLTSLHESFGNVLVEAMNAGLPVISTDCPVGPGEILEDGKYGYLVNMKNPRNVAETILKLINEDNYDFRKRSFERSMDFSVGESVNRYISFFRRLEGEKI